MNATQLWVEMLCSECSRFGYGQWVAGNRIPIREFQRSAKDLKWRQRTSGEFTCPACDKKALADLGVTAE